MDDKTINIVLKMILSPAEFDKYKAGLKLSEEQMDKIKAKVESANKAFDEQTEKIAAVKAQFQGMREQAEKLQNIGTTIGGVGLAVGASLMVFANKYITATGQTEQASHDWSVAMKSLETSEIKVGRVVTQELLPALKEAAKLAETLASLVEKHPDAVGALGKFAIAAVGGDALISSASTIERFMTSAGGLFATQIAGGTAEAAAASAMGAGAGAGAGAGIAGGAAVAGPLLAAAQLLAIVVGVFTTTSIALDISVKTFGEKWGPVVADIFTAGFASAGKNLADAFMSWLNGKSDDSKTGQASTALGSFAAQNVQEYINYEKQKADAAAQYAEQVAQVEQSAAARRLEIINSFAEKAAQAESNYRSQSAKAASDFAAANAQASAQYYKQRADAEATYNTDMQRMAEDHQKELQRMEAEHNTKVADLTAARDALGLDKENAAYATQRAQSESDYNTEVARKREDYAKQMADLEANFVQQRAERARQYAATQAEQAQAHAQEMANLQKEKSDQLNVLDKSTNDQLAKLKSAYDKQTQTMQTAFIDRLNSMSQSIKGDTAAFQKYMQDQSAKFAAWMAAQGFKSDSKPDTTSSARANGGSVFANRSYLVGENGPEIFNPSQNGNIIPNGLTAAMLNPRSNYGRNSSNTNMLRIESSSLTMTEIMNEMDKRFQNWQDGLNGAFEAA
jgi:hypothetical protein